MNDFSWKVRWLISVLFGIAVAIMFGLLDIFFTIRHDEPSWASTYFGLVYIVFTYILAVYFGSKLPVWVKIFCSASWFIWAVTSAAIGRGSGIGTQLSSASLSVVTMLLFAGWISVPMIYIWGRSKLSIISLSSLFFIALLAANITLTVEEFIVPHLYPNGVESKDRWLVNYWKISYEAKRNSLTVSPNI